MDAAQDKLARERQPADAAADDQDFQAIFSSF
jgi:hypothetical protein